MLLTSEDHDNCYPFENFIAGSSTCLQTQPQFTSLPEIIDDLIG